MKIKNYLMQFMLLIVLLCCVTSVSAVTDNNMNNTVSDIDSLDKTISINEIDSIAYLNHNTGEININEKDSTLIIDENNDSKTENYKFNNLNFNNISSKSANVIVYELYGQDLTKYYGNSEKFSVLLTDGSGNPVSGKSIKFTVNGNTYNRTTNTYGIAQLAINLPSNNYTIKCLFYDANYANTYQSSNTIRILSTINGNNIVKYYKNGTQYYATFRDTSGNLLANTAVTFNINGILYTRTTNSLGVGQLNINLNPGT